METNNLNQPGANPQALVSVREFTGVEVFFAWMCFVFGFLFCKAFPVFFYPLGALAFMVVLLITTIVVVKFHGNKLSAAGFAAAGISLALAASVIFTGNMVVQFFAYGFALVMYSYFLYSVFGNKTEKGFSDFILIDFLKAFLVAPFLSFGGIFTGAFSVKKGKGKVFLKILTGICIAIVPTLIITALLSYDAGFSDIISRIFDGWNVGKDIACLVFGIPVGMYIYGIFISSVDKKTEKIMEADKCREAAAKARIAPISTILAATLPVLTVYVIFFISQWKYYVSGFKGILPEETIYSAYAREGFFQLCAVAFINFGIIVVVTMLMRRKNEKPTVIQKILTIVFAVFTLVLIATALSKMFLYIDVYGLTQKRIYATWLMIILAIIFVLMIVKQFAEKLKIIALSLSVFLLAFGVVSFGNVEAWIANYNVERFVSGETTQMDVDALYYLGDAAIPAMVELAEYYDEKQGTDFTEYRLEKSNNYSYGEVSYSNYDNLCEKIYSRANAYKDMVSVWEKTLPRMKAENLLIEKGVITQP